MADKDNLEDAANINTPTGLYSIAVYRINCFFYDCLFQIVSLLNCVHLLFYLSNY